MAKKILFSIILVLIALLAIISFLLLEDWVNAKGMPLYSKDKKKFFVSKVIDGDTLELSNGYTVRLAGINAPEKNTACAEEAFSQLKNFIEKKYVFLQYSEFDQYGRILGYIFPEEDAKKSINEQMLELGLAHVYSPSSEFLESFEFAENKAMQEKKCIWQYSTAEYVKDNCISINQFKFDAEGDDSKNLNDEFIVFKNSCDYEIDLENWTIKDEATNFYTFKEFILLPNYQFTLYSGSGEDTINELYWNSNNAIWNNSGDKLFLRNQQGELVLYHHYP